MCRCVCVFECLSACLSLCVSVCVSRHVNGRVCVMECRCQTLFAFVFMRICFTVFLSVLEVCMSRVFLGLSLITAGALLNGLQWSGELRGVIMLA